MLLIQYLAWPFRASTQFFPKTLLLSKFVPFDLTWCDLGLSTEVSSRETDWNQLMTQAVSRRVESIQLMTQVAVRKLTQNQLTTQADPLILIQNDSW